MKKTFLRTVGVFVATVMLCLGALPAYAEDLEVDCSVEGNCYTTRPFRKYDVIRYDNSETKWSTVKVYFWGANEYNPFIQGHSQYHENYAFDWDTQRPVMNRVDNTDIWEYEIPTKEEYCRIITNNNESDYLNCVDYYSSEYTIDSICGYYTYGEDDYRDCINYYSKYNDWTMSYYDGLWTGFDHLVFSDNEGGTHERGKQTANLSFIDSGYIYKSECIVGDSGCRFQDDEAQGKWRGLWYLYDKSELIDLLNTAKVYANKIDCVEEDEAKAFVDLVNGIDENIDYYFVVQTDEAATTGWYWTYSDVAIDQLTEQIASVKNKYGESPNLCKDKDNPDTFDAIGLFAGLGVVSFAGLAIGINKKRRV